MVALTTALAALLSVAGVSARGLERRVILPRAGSPTATNQCVPFYIGNGQTTTANTGLNVCIDISGGQVTVRYPTFTDSKTYTNVHVWLGCSAPTDSNPGTSPGQYPITTGGKGCTISTDLKTATCTAALPTCVGCDSTLYIISHADTSAGTGQGFVQGQCIKSTCSPWFTYWSVKPSCQCATTRTFPPVSTSSLVGASTDIASTSTSCGLATTVVPYTTSTLTYYPVSQATSTVTFYSYYLASTPTSELALFSTSVASSYVSGVSTQSTDCGAVSATNVVSVSVTFSATCPYVTSQPPVVETSACT